MKKYSIKVKIKNAFRYGGTGSAELAEVRFLMLMIFGLNLLRTYFIILNLRRKKTYQQI